MDFKKLLDRCGISKAELNRRTRISRSTIDKFEKGEAIRADKEYELLLCLMTSARGYLVLSQLEGRVTALGHLIEKQETLSLHRISTLIDHCTTSIRIHFGDETLTDLTEGFEPDVVGTKYDDIRPLGEAMGRLKKVIDKIGEFHRQSEDRAFKKRQP